MSLTITPQILGQQANSTLSYMFIGEPLKLHITDSDSTVSEIYADVTQIDTETGVAETTLEKYVLKDITSLGGVTTDLTKVITQLHDFDVYKYQSVANIVSGWESVVSKYIYKFEFYTNQSETKTEILKLPIIGGRNYQNFSPTIDHTVQIQEIQSTQLQQTYLKGYSVPSFTLKDISLVTDSNYAPTSSELSITTGEEPCEGVIHFKSKLGAWVSWGMNLASVSKSHSYNGNISIGMFESTSYGGGGSPYVPVDYTGSSTSFSISLKSLSLSADILKSLAEINGTPAVYYQATPTSKLELMRLTSASAPIKSLIQGGDFTVSLKRISQTSSRVR
jgi:hypothetical protein